MSRIVSVYPVDGDEVAVGDDEGEVALEAVAEADLAAVRLKDVGQVAAAGEGAALVLRALAVALGATAPAVVDDLTDVVLPHRPEDGVQHTHDALQGEDDVETETAQQILDILTSE